MRSEQICNSTLTMSWLGGNMINITLTKHTFTRLSTQWYTHTNITAILWWCFIPQWVRFIIIALHQQTKWLSQSWKWKHSHCDQTHTKILEVIMAALHVQMNKWLYDSLINCCSSSWNFHILVHYCRLLVRQAQNLAVHWWWLWGWGRKEGWRWGWWGWGRGSRQWRG